MVNGNCNRRISKGCQYSLMEPNDYRLIQSEVNKIFLHEDDKEDFVQDICLKLLESKPSFISRPYLRTLIRHMLMDRYRKGTRRPTLVFDNKDYADIVSAKDYEQETSGLADRHKGGYDIRTRKTRKKRK